MKIPYSGHMYLRAVRTLWYYSQYRSVPGGMVQLWCSEDSIHEILQQDKLITKDDWLDDEFVNKLYNPIPIFQFQENMG